MTKAQPSVLLQHIWRLAGSLEGEQWTDRELLSAYARNRDEEAFACLVRRHGPMVWHVCRRAQAHQDAEDAFQATFIVLARKAGAVRWRASVAPWLYTVAQRLAAKARAQAAQWPRTGAREPAAPDPFAEMSARELLLALDAEVAALPERYRAPLVLCCLEGKTQQQAARLLAMSLSTVRRCLERGKKRLHVRLARKGLTPMALLGASTLARATAPMPSSAWTAALPAAAATARASALAEGLVVSTTGKLKGVAVLFLAACLASAGVGLAAHATRQQATLQAPEQPPGLPLVTTARTPRDALGDPLPPGALRRLGSVRLRHAGTLQSLAYSPSGHLLASAGWDRVIRFWDPATGRELRQITGPANGVNVIAFSSDGKLLAGGAVAAVVYLWDVATGRELRRLGGHQGQVRVLAFAPRGDLLAAGDEKSLRLWHPSTGKLLRSVEAREGVSAAAFSTDGGILAVATADKGTCLWDAHTGKLLRELRGAAGFITGMNFTPDGKRLLTTGSDDTLIWEVATGKVLGSLAPGRASRGSCAALAPAGKLLAVGGADQVLRLWDWVTGKEVLRLPRHPDRIRALAFSPDGKTLASAADGGVFHLWDTRTGQPRIALPGHNERLTSVAYTADGRTVVTAAWDGTVRLWNAKTGQQMRRFKVEDEAKRDYPMDPATLSRVALSPDGRLVAAVRGDEIVQVWDTATSKLVHQFRAGSLAFSPDGRLIACGERGSGPADANMGVIRLYDRATGKCLRELRGHLTAIASLSFSRDGKTLVSRGYVLLGFRTGEPGESETKFVRFWDVATGQERRSLLATAKVNGVTLSPDGRALASTPLRGTTATLWELATGGKRATLTGHTEMIFAMAFSPDGRTLASGSMDGTIRLWALPSGKEVGRLVGHRGWVLALAFSPDGKELVSGSMDTTALVWDVRRFTHRKSSLVELSPAELASCWKDLGGDAATGYRAMATLARSPDRAVSFLSRQLRPVAAPPAQRLAQLIAQLDHKRFSMREQASQELEKMGDTVAPALRQALAGRPALEVERRLQALLNRLDGMQLAPAVLWQLRAIEVLEYVGTPAARQPLERLAAGAPGARPTEEARAALGRLAARPISGP
jgi:RNA polymerase sigma factor (sigma-70 family)